MEDFTSIHPEDDKMEENGKHFLKKPSFIPTLIFSILTIALLTLSIVSACVSWPALATGLLFGGTGLSYLITAGIYSNYNGNNAFYEFKQLKKKIRKNDKNYAKENKKSQQKDKMKGKSTEEENEEELEFDEKDNKKQNSKDKNEIDGDNDDDKETTYEEEDNEVKKNNRAAKINKKKINEKREKTK